MKWLIASDTHLTDSPRDEYRWGLFGWLAKQQQKHNVTHTFILGDLTDRKDNHSSALVNRIIEELLLLRPPVYILMGNHDFRDRQRPFFRFLEIIDGVNFITEPTFLEDLGLAMIPHQPDQTSFDRACAVGRPGCAVMLHACLDGAIAETGSRLTGLAAAPISVLRPSMWYCGDIHKPQVLDCGAEYVGAPYQVRFGDNYLGRVILHNGSKGTDLHYPCLRKWTLTINGPEDLHGLSRGDHVKLTVNLGREDLVRWADLKQAILAECKNQGLEVFGIGLEISGSAPAPTVTKELQNPQQILTEYCKQEQIPENIKQTGMEIIGAGRCLT